MKIIDIKQGTPAWHEHRRAHWNASDAAAMMGCDTNRTRSQLLHELHTGLRPEVSAYAKEHVLDEGHRCEALARPLAERIVGEDLYPIVVAEGRMSASLDGATAACDVNFEHKRLNEALRESMTGDFTGADLPRMYRVQMEHQLACSGAARTLFMASDWNGDTLVEERHCWYSPDPSLRAQVLAGWAQFEHDLAAYTPPEAAPVAVAAPQEHLPAVSVKVSGNLAVHSNLAALGPLLRAYVERIPKNPITDQEFADVGAAGKRLREVQAAIDRAVNDALAGVADVNELQRLGRELSEVARVAAIACEKAESSGKEAVKARELTQRQSALVAHIAAANQRLGGAYINGLKADFAGVIKGLKTLASLRDKLDTELARAKIECTALEARITSNLATLAGAGADAQALFADKRDLVLKDPEAVTAIVAQRVTAEETRLQTVRDAEAARVKREAEAAAVPATPALSTVGGSNSPPRFFGGGLRAGVVSIDAATVGPLVTARDPVKLGDMSKALGLDLREAFVRDVLKVDPMTGTKGAAVFFAGADEDLIYERLLEHVASVRTTRAAAPPPKAPPAPVTVPAPKSPPPTPAPAETEPAEAVGSAASR